MSPPRLAIILSHPTQYYSPWFRWLQSHVPLELRVFYLWDFGVAARRDPEFGHELVWDIDLLSGYSSEFAPNRSVRPGTDRFGGLRNPDLPARLAAWRPDAVLIFGYRYATHLRIIWWCRRQGIPMIFRGDSHLLGQPRPPWRKRILLRALYQRFAAVTYVGAANRAYFRAFGVPDDRLHFAPHAVDHTLFDPTNPVHREAAEQLRRRLALPTGRRVVLFAGKLIPRKQPGALLEAFFRVVRPDVTLLFVGDGDEKARLQTRAAEVPHADVRFLPFTNQSEMPALFLASSVFVLPSAGPSETWGLAVNEAMHMEVPCLVSDVVGCQQDLVTDGETGWVFRASDLDQLALKLAEGLHVLAGDVTGLKSRIASRIGRYTFAEASEGLAQAVRAALANP